MKKLWDTIDGSLLKTLPNPASGYEQYIDIPEFTFLGVHNQPDFGHVRMWFHGQDTTIELKSLKEYLLQYLFLKSVNVEKVTNFLLMLGSKSLFRTKVLP